MVDIAKHVRIFEACPTGNCSPPMQAPITPQQFQSQPLWNVASFTFDCEDLSRPLSIPL